MFDRLNEASPFRDAMRFDRMAWGMIQSYLFGSASARGAGGFTRSSNQAGISKSLTSSFLFRGVPINRTVVFRLQAAPTKMLRIRPCLLHPEAWRSVAAVLRPVCRPRIRYNFLPRPRSFSFARGLPPST